MSISLECGDEKWKVAWRTNAKNNCRGGIKVKLSHWGINTILCENNVIKKECLHKIILCFSALNPHSIVFLFLSFSFFLGKLFFVV